MIYWKTWCNMFTYFCCEWTFRIIFTSINLFYYIVMIRLNNKWCFIMFLILIKFLYFSVFRRHNYITKIFYILFLLRKNEGNSDNKNHRDVYTLFLLIMAIVLLLQDYTILLHLQSLKNNLFFTIWIMFWNISGIYFLLISTQNI